MRKKTLLVLLLTVIFIVSFSVLQISHSDSTDNNILDSWVGNYSFYEFIPPNINREYLIYIRDEEEGLIAYIKMDGFQTLKRFVAKVSVSDNEAILKFEGYFKEEDSLVILGESIKKGDILLSLKKQGGDIITEWGFIQPFITENEAQGKYFTKESPYNKDIPEIKWEVFEIEAQG